MIVVSTNSTKQQNIHQIILIAKSNQVFLLMEDLSKKSSNEYKMCVILQKLIPSIKKDYNVWMSI